MKRIISLAVMLGASTDALALNDSDVFGDFTGCTFYKDSLYRHFDGCADFQTHNCWYEGPLGTKLPGTRVSMYLPEYFVEVQGAFGESVFTDVKSLPGTKIHMDYAKNYYKTTYPNAAVPEEMESLLDSGVEEGSIYRQVRIIKVPYGHQALNYVNVPVAGSTAPPCYEAISELVPEQWYDNAAEGVSLRSPTTWNIAALLGPIAMKYCYSGAAAGLDLARGAIGKFAGSIPRYTPIQTPGGLSGCALSVSAAELQAKMYVNPRSALHAPLTDPNALCNGSRFGPLIPRTGHTGVDDPATASLVAAYSFSSLAADAWLNSALKITKDDKLQQVWPKAAKPEQLMPAGIAPHLSSRVGACGRPAYIDEDTVVSAAIGEKFGVDNTTILSLSKEDLNKRDYTIYAVWRYRQSGCLKIRSDHFHRQKYKVQKDLTRRACTM